MAGQRAQTLTPSWASGRSLGTVEAGREGDRGAGGPEARERLCPVLTEQGSPGRTWTFGLLDTQYHSGLEAEQ